MNSVGIREAKARLSALARAAAAGKPTLLTDYGKPLAIIAPIAEDAAKAADDRPLPSDAAAFLTALLAMPYDPELGF
jgi:antitoxin (DNA-binding transcriptional repressor) of toxin-antitoxin stability system